MEIAVKRVSYMKRKNISFFNLEFNMNMVNAKEALQISKDAGWQEVLNVLITDAARAGLTVVTVTPGLHSEFKGVEQARVYNKLLMMGFGISPVGKTGFEIRWG